MSLKDVKAVLWFSGGVSEFNVISLFEQISKGRNVLSILDSWPINFFKKLMLLQILNRNSQVWIFLKQTQQNISELKTHSPNLTIYFLAYKLLFNHFSIVLHTKFSLVLVLDQNLFELKLEHKYSHRPQISTLIKSSIDDFRCHIFDRSKESRYSFSNISLD